MGQFCIQSAWMMGAGRVIATGGGGYAIEDVVPRAWAIVWSLLRGLEPAAALFDPDDLVTPLPNNHAEMNDKTMRAVRARVMPLVTGWGLAF